MGTFHITVEEKAWCTRTVTYTVEADNHDDARDQFYMGEAEVYDYNGDWDDYSGVDDQNVEDVECQECYSSYDCSCNNDAGAELDEFLAFA